MYEYEVTLTCNTEVVRTSTVMADSCLAAAHKAEVELLGNMPLGCAVVEIHVVQV